MLNYFSTLQIVTLAIFSFISGPVGVMTSWLRISFLIDALSHSSILGISLDSYFNTNQSLAVFFSNILVAIIVFFFNYKGEILAVTSQIFVALGMIIIFFGDNKVNHMHYLCGHMHEVSELDLAIITSLAFLVLSSFLFFKKQIFLTILSEELALIAGYKTKVIKFFSLLIITGLVTESSKIAGILSSSAIFLIPPLFLKSSINHSMIMSSLISIFSVCASIFIVEMYNLPIGPSIVLCTLLFSFLYRIFFTKLKNTR